MSAASARQSHREWIILGGLAMVFLFGSLIVMGRHVIGQHLPASLVQGIKCKYRLATSEEGIEPGGQTVEDAVEELETASADSRLASIAHLGDGSTFLWAKQAVPRLVEVLKSENEAECLEAIKALIKLSNTAVEAIPDVMPLLGHASGEIRQCAVEFLLLFGRKSHRDLQVALNSPDDRRFASAASVLAQYPCYEFKQHEARLQKLSQHADPTIRMQITTVLGKVASPQAVKLLHQQLKDADTQVRIAAIQSLERIQSQQVHLVATLQPVLQNGDAEVKEAVIAALSHHPESHAVVKYLDHLQNSETDDYLRSVLQRARCRMEYQLRNSR
ncbi:MAG TPA: HEAT repeat domain-containing protein [Gemmatales bacterium]|nr:HEAT repeat domain-containing protein [Gemmatales bacterium]